MARSLSSLAAVRPAERAPGPCQIVSPGTRRGESAQPGLGLGCVFGVGLTVFFFWLFFFVSTVFLGGGFKFVLRFCVMFV